MKPIFLQPTFTIIGATAKVSSPKMVTTTEAPIEVTTEEVTSPAVYTKQNRKNQQETTTTEVPVIE